jgi:hypothetical protein
MVTSFLPARGDDNTCAALVVTVAAEAFIAVYGVSVNATLDPLTSTLSVAKAKFLMSRSVADTVTLDPETSTLSVANARS